MTKEESTVFRQILTGCAKKGMTRYEMATFTGRSYSVIVSHLQRLDIDIPREWRHRTSSKRICEMAQLYKTGHTLQAIGDKYGLTRERVRQLIKRVNVVPNTIKRDIREKKREQVNKLVAQGVCKYDACKQIHLNPACVTISPEAQFTGKTVRRDLSMQRLLSNTRQVGDCLVWTRGTSPITGFPCGTYRLISTSVRIQVAVWTYHHGKPTGNIHNTCGNILCCNINHLADLNDSDVCQGRRRTHLTYTKILEVQSYFDKGLTDYEIGQRCGLAGVTIKKIRQGHIDVEKIRKRDEKYQQVREAEGSCAEIAKRFNMNSVTVWKVRNKG